jgi:hypothetical protein
MDVLVERLSQLEQEQEMEAREFQLVVLQVYFVVKYSLTWCSGSGSASFWGPNPHQLKSKIFIRIKVKV